MFVSLRWLKDYIDIDLTPAELADRLTMAGLEVDAVRETAPDFSRVVVAKILSIRPHPDSEKLSLCEVTTGTDILPIVCGAGNIQVGDVVPLACVGATIPGGYTIKSSRIQEERSEGMLCSEEELGIGPDRSGIMILPDELPLGQDLIDALNLRDIVLDIGVTPNRPDCLSMIGVAREIAAMTGGKLKTPEILFTEDDEDINGITSVEILDPDLCPRYTARIVKNVTIRPSPFWMRRRLESVGLRAINNVVDVTNFVMLECGQPLHAFDYRFLKEGRIVVRKSRQGDTFISLDEKERMLRADTLMICDGVGPVAIAGIMGGLNSEIKDDTRMVLLEGAYFNPTSIRKSSRWLGMSTDAAFRFERGIDPEGVVRALNRAAQLIADLSGGAVCRGYIDQYPKKIESPRDIPLRISRVRDILGKTIAPAQIVRILKNIGMAVNKADGSHYRVTPPSFRVDISREIDLIEEIARLHGYDRIPVTRPAISFMSTRQDPRKVLEERIRTLLNGYGYSEVITYSFIPATAVEHLGLPADDVRRAAVAIRNPLTEEQAVMRTTMIYSLLETMRRNADAGCFDLKLFEMGRTYLARKAGTLPAEQNRIGGILTGARYDDGWHYSGLASDFFDLKGCLEGLFDHLKIAALKFRSDLREPFLHPGRSCCMTIGKEMIGFLGEVHPDVLARMDLKNRAMVFEMDLDVLAGHFSGALAYRDISRFPSSSRDVAFLISRDVTAEAIIHFSLDMHEELLEKVCIFDVYEGKGIPEGMTSLGLRFSYRAHGRTLTDQEISRAHKAIVQRIVEKSGAKIR
ncbi:MAG: phenylalanine--tRNA ligase subunit beta [Deltaproteobacteria bacterium HGW-Deltaproteobacteria-9]|nr:MAG: phenylalanine--tRNA ligase subunit beta [Deltaproteobacteria bacterium HGW-Deltaproteobacteria-9]